MNLFVLFHYSFNAFALDTDGSIADGDECIDGTVGTYADALLLFVVTDGAVEVVGAFPFGEVESAGTVAAGIDVEMETVRVGRFVCGDDGSGSDEQGKAVEWVCFGEQ